MYQPKFLGSMTLKALLEDPNLKNPPIIGQSGKQVKKEEGSDLPQYNYGSAFLGSTLWDKSNGIDLNLEYMDLDEFLSENTMENTIAEDDSLPVNPAPNQIVSSPREFLRTPPLSPSHYLMRGPTVTPPQPSQPFPTQPSADVSHEGSNSCSSSASSPSSSPGSPSFNVDFQVSEQDLALTVAPGHNFDPRKRNFTDEELKPQPIIKKSKKIFVPEDLKDDKYWCRRIKNNYAAKRSRDARRVKENQIALRAAYLEKENKCLKDEMSKLRKDNAKLKTIVDKYEPGATDDTWPSL